MRVVRVVPMLSLIRLAAAVATGPAGKQEALNVRLIAEAGCRREPSAHAYVRENRRARRGGVGRDRTWLPFRLNPNHPDFGPLPVAELASGKAEADGYYTVCLYSFPCPRRRAAR
ncbi:hypothetical protein LMG29739_05003 [Paraburkholderia solisilvae]|uniref:Uncharacterized protein n=1 Tax=Paraburkholderia solisilvae TaxID=624376 RepID=A0A6J5EKV4_9BURK|nr:hypothetical protein LMG29739_05003 [Paraburkholderia solisilvae]